MEKPDVNQMRRVVSEAVAYYDDPAGQVLGVLDYIQNSFGYISEESLDIAGETLGVSASNLRAVRDFFRGFTSTPLGRHVFVVCDGTACHTKGAPEIVQLLEEELGISAGQTTPDGEFSLMTAHCVGSCGSAPILQIDGDTFARVRLADVVQMVKQVRR